MNPAISLRWRIANAVLLISAICLPSSAIAAATLDAKAARDLISGHMWQQKRIAGPGYIYWSWKSDGTVCLRLDEKTGSCADTGRWKLDGDRMCYEITWWEKSSGGNSGCFRIVNKGNGRYETLQDNGLTLYVFTIAE
jgi:hypothetical protein